MHQFTMAGVRTLQANVSIKFHAHDVTMDTVHRRFLLADAPGKRVLALSERGEFLKNVVAGETDGLENLPKVVYIRDNTLYVYTDGYPLKLHVYKLK